MKNIIKYIKDRVDFKIDIAVVTGSGLSDLKNILENSTVIHYSEIPGYFNTTVKGHDGAFYFGKFQNKYILIAVGRFHFYEGLTLEEVGLPIQVFKNLGCKKIILTNSAGCLQTKWNLGDVMIVSGHYDFTFQTDSINPQLVSGQQYYNEDLIQKALKIKSDLRMGNYGWVLGPMYETRAEIQNMQFHGVNAVGMSTVPEVIMANKLGVTTLVLSLMSNYAIGLTDDELSHQTVLDNSIKYNQNFKLLLISILSQI
jgi:purine-nucleoside phosphorylase